jgi:hypothetical protein
MHSGRDEVHSSNPELANGFDKLVVLVARRCSTFEVPDVALYTMKRLARDEG